MAWTAPATWVVGQIVTAALMNTHVRDDLRYLKGLDGVPTIQGGLIVDNSLGTEYLTVPALTTAQRDALTPVNGMMIYNSTLAVHQRRENGAWISYNNLATMVIASQAIGDLFYASSVTAIARLGIGATNTVLGVSGGIPTWLASLAKMTSGSYTGDSTVNRAIAHGLGVTPKVIFLMRQDTPSTVNWFQNFNALAALQYNTGAGSSGQLSVTAPDATNFYVGNAGSYANSANFTGIIYDWIAFA